MTDTNKPKHGGTRAGAGRKPLDAAQRAQKTSVTVTQAQREKLTRLGGSAWVRAQIDAAPEPSEQANTRDA